MADEVLFETKGQVAVISINRPEKRNAITPPMQGMLRDAFKRFRDDDDLRVAVLTGAGDKAFTAGADLKDIGGRDLDVRRMRFWRSNPEERYLQVYKPVVAAINGYCYGDGLNLLCAMTDIRIASDTAHLLLCGGALRVQRQRRRTPVAPPAGPLRQGHGVAAHRQGL